MSDDIPVKYFVRIKQTSRTRVAKLYNIVRLVGRGGTFSARNREKVELKSRVEQRFSLSLSSVVAVVELHREKKGGGYVTAQHVAMYFFFFSYGDDGGFEEVYIRFFTIYDSRPTRKCEGR